MFLLSCFLFLLFKTNLGEKKQPQVLFQHLNYVFLSGYMPNHFALYNNNCAVSSCEFQGRGLGGTLGYLVAFTWKPGFK